VVLARGAEQITLLEIFEAIEGPLALQRCLQPAVTCERQEGCALCGVFEQAQDQVKDVFSRTTVADLVKRHVAAGAPHRRTGVPASVRMPDAAEVAKR
jgi:DNA-binding IscR family transcriptional regulator